MQVVSNLTDIKSAKHKVYITVTIPGLFSDIIKKMAHRFIEGVICKLSNYFEWITVRFLLVSLIQLPESFLVSQSKEMVHKSDLFVNQTS